MKFLVYLTLFLTGLKGCQAGCDFYIGPDDLCPDLVGKYVWTETGENQMSKLSQIYELETDFNSNYFIGDLTECNGFIKDTICSQVLPPCNARGTKPKRVCPESCVKQKNSICFQDITFGNSQFREWFDSLDCEGKVNVDDCWNMTIPTDRQLQLASCKKNYQKLKDQNEEPSVYAIDVSESILLEDLRRLKESYGRRRKKHVECKNHPVAELKEHLESLDPSKLRVLKNLRLQSLDNVKTHGSCEDVNKTSVVYHVGMINRYKADGLLAFDNVNVLLRWNRDHQNGSIEGFGYFRFCNEGKFKYHLYQQDDSITALRSHSVEPISWTSILTLYPMLNDTNSLSLWKQIYGNLKISTNLELKKMHWYNFWDADVDDSWSFFKSRPGATTNLHFPAFGNSTVIDKKLKLMNFEAITNKKGTLNYHSLSFELDFQNFVKFFIHPKVSKKLNKLFSFEDLSSFISIDGSAEFVGVHGTIIPEQFSKFHLLVKRSNFLPFNIYGGQLSDESYIQVYAKIEEHPRKPLWMDRGHVHFYAREFKNGEHLNYYIEFLPRNGLCEQKKMSDFDSLNKKLESIGVLHKKVYKTSCPQCCDDVPTLKLITIATEKKMVDDVENEWFLDIQMRTKTQLIKWVLKRGRKISLNDFMD